MPTPKFANLQQILAEESEPETGVVSEKDEERLEKEMRRVLIDFFERFFLWCAMFRPVKGSRGMRMETRLTRFGKVRVARRFVPENKEWPGFLGRFGRRTKACEDAVAEEGCDGLKHWSDEAAKAWKYLDDRREHMNYGWPRRHGYLIGSGHIESACKAVIGQRCKGAGMHWRYENALYVTALRARMRSAA